jgi:hypothetical protein
LIDAIRILPINVFEALENSNEVFLLAPEIEKVPEIEGIFQPRTDEYPFRGKARDVRQDPQKIVFRYNVEEDIETQYDRLTKIRAGEKSICAEELPLRSDRSVPTKNLFRYVDSQIIATGSSLPERQISAPVVNDMVYLTQVKF